MSGGTTTQSGTTNQVNQIPQWMTDAGQQNYAFAQQVAEQPLQQYQGQMVADTAPQTQQSWNTAANSGSVGADQYNAATSGYLGALSQTPMQVQAGQISNTNLQPYMNPFTNSVINATLPLMQQQNALSQNQQANAANSANAFGGSRQGIQQGVAQAQGAMNIGQMAAGLNSANFQQAQAAATGDLQRSLAANQGNQQAQQAAVNSDIAASQGLANTGDSMNKANVANFNMQQSAGAGQSMQAQNDINAQMAKFNQAFNYPQQQLGTMLSALGMTPHDTSSAGQTTSQTTTPTDWADIIQKGAGAAANIYGMSDKSMKTDITDLGKDPKTGLKMHAFRYKGDPKSYPKVVGPMAQDVEKKFPGSTAPMGEDGKLAIRGYAAGTSFVQPDMQQIDQSYFQRGKVPDDLAGIADPTPPGQAGLKALLDRGYAYPSKARGYAAGTPFVQPDMEQIDKSYFQRGKVPDDLVDVADPTPAGKAGLKDLLDRGYAYPKHYAVGTPFVQPSLAAFTPKSSPGVATGIGALSAFRPPVKLPRGATIPKMQKFADGTADVQAPDMDDAELGSQITGGDLGGDSGGTGVAAGLKNISDLFGGGKAKPVAAAPQQQSQPKGWGAPSMGYALQGFARGAAQVPGQGFGDNVPSLLTPGEAVLTPGAAQHVGRSNVAMLNAMHPPQGSATAMPRAGARGIMGALANTKIRPKVVGGLSG